MSLMSLTAVALGKKVQAGEVTVEEAVLDALEQIEKKEDTIHSYVTVLEKEAILEKAKEIQKKIDAGELTGPLAGVPVAIKDNMCTEGVLTTCSSKILYNFVPTYTSEKQTWMSSRWEVQQRPLLTELRETHTIRSMYRAVLPVVPVRQLRRRNVPLPLVQIPAVLSASQVHSVV